MLFIEAVAMKVPASLPDSERRASMRATMRATSKRKLTHVDEKGAARMVEVGAKPETAREAVASGIVFMQPATVAAAASGVSKKGDVLQVARLAAIEATKRTPDLIPLCHPVRVTGVDVNLTADEKAGCITIRVAVRAHDRTGVEMEALTAVAAAGLTLYDMLKAVDRGMRITNIQLEEKRGGRTGVWRRD
jgi:cyclic pyranopterin phosphate synthase